MILLLGWLFGAAAAQSQDASHLPRARAHASRPRMDIQYSSDVCSALTPAECCAQMLEIALFRATGDQVPPSAKAPVRLSCKEPERTIPQNACRLLAVSRGFSAREATLLCAPDKLTQRCADDVACKQCVNDLDRLDWKASARACYALTYVAKRDAVDSLRARRFVLR